MDQVIPGIDLTPVGAKDSHTPIQGKRSKGRPRIHPDKEIPNPTSLPPKWLPIPPSTIKRTGKIQDAARLYIHFRQTDIKKLSQLTGVSEPHLTRVSEEDGWEASAHRQLAIIHGDRALSPINARSSDELKEIEKERERLAATVDQFSEDRASVLEQMRIEKNKTSPRYKSLMRVFKELTEMISNAIGKADYDRERSAQITTLAKLQATAAVRKFQSSLNGKNDDASSDVIDIVEGAKLPSFISEKPGT